MEEFVIEAYLDGTLNQEEKKAFEKAMKQDADLANEVAMMRQLTKDLKTIGLREEVRAALATPSPGRFSYKWISIPVVLLLVVLYFLFFKKTPTNNSTNSEPSDTIQPTILPDNEEDKSTPTLEIETPIKEVPPTPELEAPKKPIKEKPQDKLEQPIAEATPSQTLPPPVFPAPNIRGQQQNEEAQNALLNAIWYTQYPPKNIQFAPTFEKVDQLIKDRDFSKAYIRLQFLERKMPNNDSLQYLKAYCLLEMGEGREALRNFENIEADSFKEAAEVEWYKGIAFLMTNNKDQALAIFEKISNDNNHPFQQQALKALNLIK
jgi:hypothetical protein